MFVFAFVNILQPHYQVIQSDLYHSFTLLVIHPFLYPCICDLYQQTSCYFPLEYSAEESFGGKSAFLQRNKGFCDATKH